jgi:hypothetical protein
VFRLLDVRDVHFGPWLMLLQLDDDDCGAGWWKALLLLLDDGGWGEAW